MKLSNWINQWTATVALDAIGTMVLNFAIKLVIALVILFIGSKIIKYIVKLLDKFMGQVNLDQGGERFLVSLAKAALYAVLVIIIAHELGIDTTSFIALLASSGVAIGLALQGSLSNFAGGVLILVLHPFGIGDYIIDNSSGKEGVVEDIKLFYTKLVTGDNKVVTIPNGALSNAAITNVSEKPIRRIDFNV